MGEISFLVFLRSLVAPLCRDDIFAVFVISNERSTPEGAKVNVRNLKDVLEILRYAQYDTIS